MVAASCVGGLEEDGLDAGCAIEMVHAFSLIHDDLPAIDNDDLRRGRPTCHKQFGEAMAILAGDALFALAFEVLSSGNAPADRLLQASRILSRAVGSDGLVGGEVVDVISEGQDVDHSTLEFIHTRKTGALIAAACEIGGLLGGGSPAQVQALRCYGEHIGLAFQIADDLLNELSTAEQLGKAVGTDRERKKATYPALHGLDEARSQAQKEASLAVKCLCSFGGPAKQMLIDMASYSIERTK
jgi:geranylgeranyl diphosphate synthase type II